MVRLTPDPRRRPTPLPTETTGLAQERVLEGQGQRFFDMRGCSPFMRYFLLTTKGSAEAAAPKWKRVHAGNGVGWAIMAETLS